jgi:hypothetical protein
LRHSKLGCHEADWLLPPVRTRASGRCECPLSRCAAVDITDSVGIGLKPDILEGPCTRRGLQVSPGHMRLTLVWEADMSDIRSMHHVATILVFVYAAAGGALVIISALEPNATGAVRLAFKDYIESLAPLAACPLVEACWHTPRLSRQNRPNSGDPRAESRLWAERSRCNVRA